MGAIDEVRRYYDANTPSFERYGQSGGVGAVRRAVWAEGVATRDEAFRYVDRFLLAALRELAPRFEPPLRAFDFGCGVGGSLAFLAAHEPIEGVGLTLSARQAELARARFEAAGIAGRVRCVEASYLDPPPDLGRAHLVFAVEAFVHSPDPAAFFASAAERLAPGGRLVVCDDFLTPAGERPRSAREARAIDEFRRGWLAASLVTAARADELAAAAGLAPVEGLSLTARLELGRPRDRFIAALVALGRRLPLRGYYWMSLLGGNALQAGLQGGLIDYRIGVWQKGQAAGPPR
ncbi:MAG TPA: class I SAM-dependent methyltransferase [Polyangiaceae bacterium]|nr:class I SAM-dependent methyltransferase [Polyangiaceae bacterium]